MTSPLAQQFMSHEDSSGVELLREFLAEHSSGTHHLEFNVWLVDLDLDRGMIQLAHDFDPLEGSMPLGEFLSELDELCPSEENRG